MIDERMAFDQMVMDFAEKANFALEQDDDGVWTIPIGANVFAHILYHVDLRQVLVYASIGELPAGSANDEARARALLAANYYWQDTRGFTLAIEHETRHLVVQDRRAFSAFETPEGLADYLTQMGETVRDLTPALGALADEAETEVVG